MFGNTPFAADRGVSGVIFRYEQGTVKNLNTDSSKQDVDVAAQRRQKTEMETGNIYHFWKYFFF
jgi:hypothetical protein